MIYFGPLLAENVVNILNLNRCDGFYVGLHLRFIFIIAATVLS